MANKVAKNNGQRRRINVESDADLARLWIDDITSQTGFAPIFARGKLYSYSSVSGIWEEVDDIRLQLQNYHRTVIVPNRRGQQLLISRPLQEAAVATIQTLCEHPSFFDEAPLGIAFTNGFLEVAPTSLNLLPHSGLHRCSFGFDFHYSADCGSPLSLLDFLQDVWAPDPDCDLKIQTLQQFLGACILGISPRFQQSVILHGPTGNNGKSLLTTGILSALFPPATRRAVKPTDWSNEYYRALLASCRINIVGELPDTEILDSGDFKAIIAGDEITARQIHSPPFNFRPCAGHIFAGNTLPGVKDHTNAFFRRFIVLTFNRTFTTEVSTQQILQPILNEIPQIVAWSLASIPQLLTNNHYTVPPSSDVAISNWRAASDQAALFINSCCVKGGSTPCLEAFSWYQTFANSIGFAKLNFNNFSRRLSLLGLESRRGKTGYIYPITIMDQKMWRTK